VFERHESPTPEARVFLIEPPLASQHARDAVRTRELHLDIASARVRDPHMRSDVLEPFKVAVLEHLARHLERGRDAVLGQWRSVLGRRRCRLRLDRFGCSVGIGLSLGRSRLVLTAVSLSVVIGQDRAVGVRGQEELRRVEPRLRLDELPRFRILDKQPRIEPAVSVCSELASKLDIGSNSSSRTLVAVVAPSCRLLPVRVRRVEEDAGADGNVLKVTPRELGPGSNQQRRITGDPEPLT
jgi:hypothetical protein